MELKYSWQLKMELQVASSKSRHLPNEAIQEAEHSCRSSPKTELAEIALERQNIKDESEDKFLKARMNIQRFYTPSTPIQSQEAFQSVEFAEPVPALWGQPPPLPLQAVQYRTQSSSTSNQQQQQQQSSESSPYHPSSRAQAASSQQAPSRGPASPVKELTREDHIRIFRLAVQAEDVYGHSTLKNFWQTIADTFEKETGKKHKTLARATSNIIKARRKVIADAPPGEAPIRTNYTEAIDEWIHVVDAHSADGKDRPDQTKAARGRQRMPSADFRKQVSSSNASTDGNDESLLGGGGGASRYRELNTPVDSMAENTPVEEGGGGEMRSRKRRRRMDTGQGMSSSADEDLLRDFRRFVTSFEAHIAAGAEARFAGGGDEAGIGELRADVRVLNERIGGLEKNMSSILELLKDR